MSFVVTGLAWQWFLNPTFGLQKLVRDLGFESFTFDWLVNQQMVIYTLVIAGLWHASGLVMAILLAGLRGVDADLWKAAKVDGIPTWRVYLSIVLPLLGPMVVTVTVLLVDPGGPALRPRRRHDPRRPRHRLGSPGQVRHGPPVRAQQYRARHGGCHHDAGHRGLPCSRPGSTRRHVRPQRRPA